MTEEHIAATALRSQLERVLSELLQSTAASRTTLRMDLPKLGFHVDDPCAEALTSGVRPLSGQTALDQRKLETVRWMDKHRDFLIQNQCEGADPAPPDALLEVYGVKAQMLGPIIRNSELAGWISVHENRDTRNWTTAEIAALRDAVENVQQILNGVT